MTADVIPHPALHLEERIEDARREVAFTEDKYEGLCNGTVRWQEWDESLTCPDRQQTAVVECGMALDDARKKLRALKAQADGMTER